MADVVPTSGRRARRKERKRMAADTAPMSSRRAYRAAQEALEQGFDLWNLAEHKARFSLMLLAPLIIILLYLLSKLDVFLALPPWPRSGILIGLVAYGGLGTVTFLLAIGTLRPERAAPVIGEAARGRRHAPLGIRHYEDVLGWEVDDYQRAWRRVTQEQLVEEVTEQAHAVAKGNRRKFRRLHYLFRGLLWMTALALLLLAAIALALVFEGHADMIQIGHDVARARAAPGS